MKKIVNRMDMIIHHLILRFELKIYNKNEESSNWGPRILGPMQSTPTAPHRTYLESPPYKG